MAKDNRKNSKEKGIQEHKNLPKKKMGPGTGTMDDKKWNDDAESRESRNSMLLKHYVVI